MASSDKIAFFISFFIFGNDVGLWMASSDKIVIFFLALTAPSVSAISSCA